LSLDNETCWNWYIRSADTDGEVTFTEKLLMPEAPDSWGDVNDIPDGQIGKLILEDGGKIGITTRKATLDDGWFGHGWCLLPGDPTGDHSVEVTIDGQPGAEQGWPCQQPFVGHLGVMASVPDGIDAGDWFQRADEHRRRPSFRFGDDVEAMVDAVDEVDVGATRGSEHGRGARRATGTSVAGPVCWPRIGLGLHDAPDAHDAILVTHHEAAKQVDGKRLRIALEPRLGERREPWRRVIRRGWCALGVRRCAGGCAHTITSRT
jgi:hypothetical protein